MHRKLPLFVLGILALIVPVQAQESLFNGKDLSGWKGLPQFWSVKDGVIVGETTAENPTKGNTFLVWQGGEVADFEITAEVRFKGNNSGLQYRSKIVDEANFVLAGYQADLHPSQNYFGMLYGEKLGKRGIIAQRGQRVEVGPDGTPKVVGEVGDKTELKEWEWNTLKVVAVGNRLLHQINGVTTVDITDSHPEALAKGVIGLQLHAGPPMRVEYKNIQFRKLSDSEGQGVLKKAIEDSAKAANPNAKPAAANAKGKGKGAPGAAAPAPRIAYQWITTQPLSSWIWRADKVDDEWIYLRKSFDVAGEVKSAKLYATCDNELELWVNGESAGRAPDWGNPILNPAATKLLKTGKNVIAARARNRGGAAAFTLKLEYETTDGKKATVISEPDWKLSLTEADGWKTVAFDDASWTGKLKAHGKFGMGPWGIAGIDGPGGGGGGGSSPLEPAEIHVVDGFKVELLYTVPKEEQGSWVALTTDDKGRLLASDQGDKGLYRIDVSGAEAKVEKMPVAVSGGQGMVWAFDALWFNKSGGKLHRVTDSDGDGKLDKAEEMPSSTGGGEHGNHAVILTEDGTQLYVDGGNHTDLPPAESISGSRVKGWQEDHILPRMWDAKGHARGRLAPGGWVTRFDPKTQKHELYCIGFRNQYDIALNQNGDLFTYDADMEWDMGTPWYRPTRICQVVSGGDYGWRSGSGKWPAYYEDSLPPVVDIGPGSPTGVASGLGAKFPAKYQNAIYALDWTFGTIYAIHLEAQGAGYTGKAEPFVFGAPLPVTDAIVGKDGAMYFTIGGRDTQSALYRVTYTKEIGKEEAVAEPKEITEARTLRRELEAFHGKENAAALEKAWPHLASTDRFLRNAARVAVESQPVAQWADKVLTATDPQTRITGAVALARQGDTAAHGAKLTAALLEMDAASLTESQLLGYLRAWQLNLIRLGKPEGGTREKVVAKLDAILPAKSANANVELVNLLVALEAPSVIEKALTLIENPGAPEIPDWAELVTRNQGYGRSIQAMLDDYPPIRGIAFAFALRNQKSGWTLDQRRRYFTFLNAAAKHPGGASFGGFLTNTRDEALAHAPNDQLIALKDITGVSYQAVPDFAITPPKGPGQVWTIESASKHANGGQFRNANYENGRSLFHAVGCGACHRMAGFGGDIGPDVTSIRNKFDVAYVLESILDPSKVISDQYGSSSVTTKSGTVHTGLVVERGDDLEIYPPDPKGEPVKMKRTDVAKIESVPVSQMPPGLINLLNGDEVRDLMAYLMSAGDPKDKVYGK
jgi:putative heme-binding domain-containing protein